MMAGGAALSSRGFAGTRRRLRVILWGNRQRSGLSFCVNPAAIEHVFHGAWKWFSCYSGIKNVAFKHENRGVRAWIPQLSGMNLAAFRQEFGKVFALESSV